MFDFVDRIKSWLGFSSEERRAAAPALVAKLVSAPVIYTPTPAEQQELERLRTSVPSINPAESAESFTYRAAKQLVADGVHPFGEGYYSVPLEARLLLLTERVNWAAKTVSPEYYALKQHMFAEAAIYGADKGVELLHRHEGKENNWNLYHPAVGVISVHDPYHEIAPLLENKHVTRSQRAYPWSGVYREDESQRLLEDPAALRAMAQQTAPAFSTAAPIKTSLGAAHALHPRQKTAHLQLAGAGAVVGA